MNGPEGTFSIYQFFRQAGVAEKEARAYADAAERENINSEELALELSSSDLEGLKVVLGDRKRILNYIKSRQGASSPKLPVEADSPSRPKDVRRIPHTDIKFNRETPIGSGHFGAVYRGRYKEGDVAIKILIDVDTEDFWKEARALQAITEQGHPNVLRFFGVCELGTQMAFITEFMVNGSLKQYLLKNAPSLTQPLLCHFARSAAAGMLHLSSMVPPVLHRDLAARNLLLGDIDAEGRPVVRVADFGLARSAADGIYHAAVKRKLPERCTAPEVWTRRGDHTIASDVYAFGVTLWEIFALGLDPAWDDEQLSIEKRKLLLPAEVRALSYPHERTIAPGVHQLLQECCALRPELRPSWREITRRLEELEQAARRAAQPAPTVKAPAVLMSSQGSQGSGAYIEASPASEAYVPSSRSSSSGSLSPAIRTTASGRVSPTPPTSASGSSSGFYVSPGRPEVGPIVPSVIRVSNGPGGYGLPVYSPINLLSPVNPRYAEVPHAQPPPQPQVATYTKPPPADEAWFWGPEAYKKGPQPTALPQPVSPLYSILEHHNNAMQQLQSSITASRPAGFPAPPPMALPPSLNAIYSTPSVAALTQPALKHSASPAAPVGEQPSNPARPDMPQLRLNIPAGFSELPPGVLKVWTTRSPLNLFLAPNLASRVIASAPAGAQVTDTLDASLMTEEAEFRQVRYGDVIGWMRMRGLLEELSSLRPNYAVFKSANTNKLVFLRRDQQTLSTIGGCTTPQCQREFELQYYIALGSFTPEMCPYCKTKFNGVPLRVTEALQALQATTKPAPAVKAEAPCRVFAEHRQHPLRWTYPGYAVGQWNCDICRKGGSTKTWHCTKCQFDICKNCFYAKGQPLCPNEHPCEWIEEHNCQCDVCAKALGVAAHWECSTCNWCCCDLHLASP